MILRGFDNDSERKLPSLLITAGIHGDEIGSMILLDLLADMFSKSDLKISVAFANYCNPDSIRHSQRQSVNADLSDLNRGWETKAVRQELEELVKSFDLLLDLHCSRACTEHMLFNNGQNVNYEWLEKQGIPFAVREGPSDTLKMLADREGQLGMTWEMKGMQFPSEKAIKKSIDVIFGKILGNWKDFAKNAYNAGSEAKNLMPEQLMQAAVPRSEGLIKWRLEGMGLGEKVARNEELGKIVSICDGTVNEKICSPCAGTVICVCSSYARPYEAVCFIQPKIETDF